MYRRFGKNDVIFICFLILFCVGVCVTVYKGALENGNFITITVDGKTYGTYSLLEDQTITIEENDTVNIIEIKDGKAYMKKASCPDQLCIKQNKISHDKESIICLPNKVVLTVTSEKESGVDGVVR